MTLLLAAVCVRKNSAGGEKEVNLLLLTRYVRYFYGDRGVYHYKFGYVMIRIWWIGIIDMSIKLRVYYAYFTGVFIGETSNSNTSEQHESYVRVGNIDIESHIF